MDLKQKIANGLNSLTSSFQRARLVALFVTACSLLYHFAICLFFYVINIKPMFYYNFLSITVFLILLLVIPKLKSFIFAYNIGLIEVIVHQILADYYLGSYCSFHSFILLMGLLPFLIFENKKRARASARRGAGAAPLSLTGNRPG